MHHLPQFFIINGDKRKKTKSPREPRLERSNARKNIPYEAAISSSSTSSSSSFAEDSSVLPVALRGSRSLDIPPLGDRTSFRIDGTDVGQLEVICRSLGIESPDDFGIPMSSWDARKMRSTSDLLPRSRLNFQSQYEPKVVKQDQLVENQRDDSFRLTYAAAVEDTSKSVRVNGGNRGGNGIKGLRPPVLSPPPPSNLKPLIDNDGCYRAHVEQEFSSSDEEAAAEMENGRRLGETVLSGSRYFTTSSNEDDSSSTTTVNASPNESGSNRSPNGRFRRITVTHWQKGALLGCGSFGSVYEGICDGGFFIAVKEVSLLDQGEQGRQSVFQLEQEIALLSQFEHENIVQYHGTAKDESKLYIFLEYVSQGSLLSLYRKYNLGDSQVSAYTRQILHGLKYLHERSVVHRDIKCANILVDANGSVKLADFGLAKATKLNDVRSCKGTAFWMAPEVVNQENQGYGLAADIWSLGCTVLEMLTRQLPYSPLECMPALFKIGSSIPPSVPDSLSLEARDFIRSCLQVNPIDRPTAAQLLDHPFVKRPFSSETH